MLTAGETYTIRWHPRILHNTTDYDLWYSTTGNDGPWLDVAMDLPATNTDQAPHSFEWTVPSVDTTNAFVRVRQDNAGDETDYYSMSNFAFSIQVVSGPTGDYNGDGLVNLADYSIWRDTIGSTTSLAANGDDTGSSRGVIDEADYTAWKSNFGAGAPLQFSSTSIPEPTSWCLVNLGLLSALGQWRNGVRSTFE